jgi:hypothetical protein
MFDAHNGYPFNTAIAVEVPACLANRARSAGLHSMPRRPVPRPIARGVKR